MKKRLLFFCSSIGILALTSCGFINSKTNNASNMNSIDEKELYLQTRWDSFYKYYDQNYQLHGEYIHYANSGFSIVFEEKNKNGEGYYRNGNSEINFEKTTNDNYTIYYNDERPSKEILKSELPNYLSYAESPFSFLFFQTKYEDYTFDENTEIFYSKEEKIIVNYEKYYFNNIYFTIDDSGRLTSFHVDIKNDTIETKYFVFLKYDETNVPAID